MLKIKKKNYIIDITLLLLVFTFFYVWFTVIHPLYFVHGDDFGIAIIHRKGLPIPGNWNPSKVLPETLMPLCTDVAMYLVFPFTKDMFFSLNIVYAICIALFITAMCYILFLYFCNNFKIEKIIVFFIILIYLALHFFVFKSKNADKVQSSYLFEAGNLCIYFNYVIPNILNLIFFIYFFIFHSFSLYDILRQKNGLFLCVFIFLIYLALFSSILSSIIMISVLFIKIIFSFISYVKKNKCKIKRSKKMYFFDFLYNYIFELLIVILFIFSNIIEMLGKRAGTNSLNFGCEYNLISFISYFKKTVIIFVKNVDSVNKLFIVYYIFTLLFGLILIVLYKNKKALNDIFKMLVCDIMILLYLLIVCAKVNPNYIVLSWVIYPVYAILFIINGYLLLFIFERIKITRYFIIILFFIIFTFCNQMMGTYADLNHINPNMQKSVLENMYNQFKDADNNGTNHIILHVPFCFEDYSCEYIEYFFNKFGLLKSYIKVDSMIREYNFNEYTISYADKYYE